MSWLRLDPRSYQLGHQLELPRQQDSASLQLSLVVPQLELKHFQIELALIGLQLEQQQIHLQGHQLEQKLVQ